MGNAQETIQFNPELQSQWDAQWVTRRHLKGGRIWGIPLQKGVHPAVNAH